jgi:hypothetical protein
MRRKKRTFGFRVLLPGLKQYGNSDYHLMDQMQTGEIKMR